MQRTFTSGGTDRTEESEKYMWLKQFLISRGAPKKELDEFLDPRQLKTYALEHGYMTNEDDGPDPDLSMLLESGHASLIEDLDRVHQEMRPVTQVRGAPHHPPPPTHPSSTTSTTFSALPQAWGQPHACPWTCAPTCPYRTPESLMLLSGRV